MILQILIVWRKHQQVGSGYRCHKVRVIFRQNEPKLVAEFGIFLLTRHGPKITNWCVLFFVRNFRTSLAETCYIGLRQYGGQTEDTCQRLSSLTATEGATVRLTAYVESH